VLKFIFILIVSVGVLAVATGAFLPKALSSEEDHSDILFWVCVCVSLAGGFFLLASLPKLLAQTGTTRGLPAQRRASMGSQARSGSRRRVTGVQDLEEIQRDLNQLTQGIEDASKAADACLAVHMTCFDAQRELQTGDREIFSQYNFNSRARFETRSTLKTTRQFCESLLADGRVLDPQRVALLERLLLAEAACRECYGGPLDGECGAGEVLKNISVDSGHKKR